MAEAPPEEDFSRLPLDEKLGHKNWKARSLGYGELQERFQYITDPNDAEWGSYVSRMKAFVLDSNLSAQEKALSCVLSFVKTSSSASRVTSDVMSGIVLKCLTSAKRPTRELSNEISLMYIEVGQSEVVIEELVKGLSAKQPKVIAACVAVLFNCVQQFGVKAMNVKPILAKLELMFGHSDKNVRAEAVKLTLELHKWIGDAIKSYLAKIKPVQLKDLETGFEKNVGVKPTQERLLRSEMKLEEKGESDAESSEEASGDASDEVEAEAEDALKYAPEVDLLNNLGSFYTEIVEKKWSIKRDALDVLVAKTKDSKIIKGDYGQFISALCKCISDVNMNVNISAYNLVNNLAVGMGTNFANYSTTVLPPLMEKTKDKKKNVLDPLRATMDAVAKSSDFNNLCEALSTIGLVHKNPNVKKETCDFISRALCNVTDVPNKSNMDSLLTPIQKLINDGAPEVREASLQSFGTIVKCVGERHFLGLLKEIDAKKAERIREFAGNAVVKCTVKAAAKPSTKAKPAAKPALKPAAKKSTKSTSKKSNTKPNTSANAGAGPIKKSSKKPTSKVSSKQPKTTSKPTKTKATTKKKLAEEKLMELSDALIVISGLVPKDILENLASKLWKERLAASQDLGTFVNALPENEIPTQALAWLVVKHAKDTNFQVIGQLLQVLLKTFERAETVTVQSGIVVASSAVVDKIADIKNQKNTSDVLKVVCERLSLSLVCKNLQEYAIKHKNPKVLSGATAWCSEAINEFGFGIDLESSVVFSKTCLNHANPAVRAEAVKLCGVLRIFTGPQIALRFKDCKPALLATLNQEFEKVANEAPPKPQRKEGTTKTPSPSPSSSEASSRSESPETEAETEGENDNLSDSDSNDVAVDTYEIEIPKTDIMPMIEKFHIVRDLKDKNWRNRDEAMKKLQSILEKAQFSIEANVGEVPEALFPRFTDNNKNQIALALNVAAALAKSIGSPFSKYVKKYVPALLNNLNDNKVNVREAAVNAFTETARTTTVEVILGSGLVSEALSQSQPILRNELLGWLINYLSKIKKFSKTQVDSVGEICGSVCLCFEDRNNDVRKKTQALIPVLLNIIGYNLLKSKLEGSSISSSAKSSAGTFIDKAKASMPAPTKTAPITRKPTGLKKTIPQAPHEGQASQLPKPKAKTKAPPRERTRDPDPEPMPEPAVEPNLPRSTRVKVAAEAGPEPVVARVASVFVFDPEDDDESFEVNLGSNKVVNQDELNELMAVCVNRKIFSQLFHDDFRQQVLGIQTLSNACDSEDLAHKAEIVKCCDVIFCYIRWLFTTAPIPRVHDKALDLLQNILTSFVNFEHHLKENQTSIFIDVLIEKLGDQKKPIAKKAQSNIRTLYGCYPSSKVFVMFLNGISSKNVRTRAACFEEINYLLDRYGVSAAPTNSFESMMLGLNDAEDVVRTASFSCFQKSYDLLHNKLFEKVGSAENKALLAEKLNVSISSSVLNKKTPTSNYQNSMVTPQKLDGNAGYNFSNFTSVVDAKVPELKNTSADLVGDTPTLPVTTSSRTSNHSEGIHSYDYLLMSIITDDDTSKTTSALEEMKSRLCNKDKILLSLSVKEMLQPLTLQFRISLSKLFQASPKNTVLSQALDTPEMHLFRLVQGTIISLIDNHSEFKQLTSEGLMPLMHEVLFFLGDQQLCEFFDKNLSNHVTKGINDLASYILKNSNKTQLLCTLLDLLTQAAKRDPVTYVHYILKSIWRSCKAMKTNKEEVLSIEWKHVFVSLHSFFKAHPVSEWSENLWREKEENQPLRTAKTVVCLPTKFCAPESIESILKELNIKETDQLYIYCLKFIQVENPSFNFLYTKADKENALLPLDAKTAALIKDIFNRITHPDVEESELKALVEEIHDMKCKHPEAEKLIEDCISQCPRFYQSYIRRNLGYLHSNRKVTSQNRQIQSNMNNNKMSVAGKNEVSARLERLKNENIFEM